MEVEAIESMVLMRLIGMVASGAGLLLLLRLFGQRRISRGGFVFFGGTSGGLFLVSLFPSLVYFVSDIVLPGQMAYQRIITLLILSTFLLWFLVVWERVKIFKRGQQLNQLIKRLGHEDFKRRYPKFKTFQDIVVLIPAFDEEHNIGSLLQRIPKEIAGLGVDVLVADDGSIDGTSNVAEQNGAFVVRNLVNMGGGIALQLGFELVRKAGGRFIITMDADGQHRPEEMPRLIDPLLNQQADVVIGSRMKGVYETDSLIRHIGIHVFNRLINIISGINISDCSNNYRGIRSDVLGGLNLLEEQYHTTELILEACKRKLRILDVPVTVERRKYGSSKKGKNLRYGFNFVRTILKSWWR